MRERLGKLTENLDYTLLIAVVLLCFYGIVILYSSTRFGYGVVGEDSLFYVKRQSLWIASGFLLLIMIILIDYHNLERFSLAIYIFSVLSLILVMVMGRITHGSRRWLYLGFFPFQASEFAKIALIIFLANFLSKNRVKLENFAYFLLPFFYTGLYVLLVFLQPDLGTSLTYIVILIIMLFVVGSRIKYLLTIFLVTFSSFPVLWHFLKDYQKRRILVFLNPNLDPLGSGYNVIQSKIAIGSGGLLGKGIFQGLQSQLKFLPAQHTDFIFSVLGEELGFMGAVLLLFLYIVIIWRGIKIALEAKDIFGALLATGAVSFFLFHIVVNIGMTMGILPTTGLPLPFISYGGSFMLTNLITVGLLLNVHLYKIKL
ncbi:MAG: rod shape-determining protein RodA [Candidatus Caldatribacteriota bacterium]